MVDEWGWRVIQVLMILGIGAGIVGCFWGLGALVL